MGIAQSSVLFGGEKEEVQSPSCQNVLRFVKERGALAIALAPAYFLDRAKPNVLYWLQSFGKVVGRYQEGRYRLGSGVALRRAAYLRGAQWIM